MSAPPGPAGPGWTRRAAGSAVLLFFVLSGGLWLGSVLSWQVGQPEFVVVLLALAAFFPLAWLAVGMRTRPVWALQLREEPTRVADAVIEAVRDLHPTRASPADVGRAGLLRGCDPVLRVEEPPCFIGIFRSSIDASTTVLLLPRSKNRESMDRLRAAIRASVLPSA